jgi:hypothetical protein
MLAPDCGTPAHRGAADPHGLQQQVRCLWHIARMFALHGSVMLPYFALYCCGSASLDRSKCLFCLALAMPSSPQ